MSSKPAARRVSGAHPDRDRTPADRRVGGRELPAGRATYDGAATNFSPYSERAERVELCLIAKDGSDDRVNLDEVDGFVWTGIELLAHRCSRARERCAAVLMYSNRYSNPVAFFLKSPCHSGCRLNRSTPWAV